MKKQNFIWDEKKNKLNLKKHGILFDIAQYAFGDSNKIIAEDLDHSDDEKRYFCFG